MNLQPFRSKTGEPSQAEIQRAKEYERLRRREQEEPLTAFEMDAKIKSLTRKR